MCLECSTFNFFIRIQDITLYLPCEPKKKTNRRKSASDKQRKHTFTKNIILILRQESISAIQSSGIITHKFSDAHSYTLSNTLETCLCSRLFHDFQPFQTYIFNGLILSGKVFGFHWQKIFLYFDIEYFFLFSLSSTNWYPKKTFSEHLEKRKTKQKKLSTSKLLPAKKRHLKTRKSNKTKNFCTFVVELNIGFCITFR